MAANSSQGIYSPLPQSLSDSDSEKEMHDVVGPKFSSRPSQNGVHKSGDNSTIYHNGYAIPNHVIEKPKPRPGFAGMSVMRQTCFVLSILLCFTTIFVFLWMLPCSQGTCPVKISNWDQIYDSLELKGKINIVQGVRGLNLVLLYRGNINSSGGGGAISVLGNNGVVAWYIPQTKEPKDINCDMLDVNGDGILDCLLLGEVGIEAIEPVSGKILWHVHTDYETKPIKNVDFPTVVPDLNGDGVKDLIMRLSIPGNKCIVVSGRTGIVLYDLVRNECDSVQGITYYDKNFIYLCRNKTSETYYRISTSDLSIRVYNRNLVIIPTKVDYRIQQSNSYSRSGYKLIVDNVGSCPDCRANITMVEEKTNKILWAYYHSYTYAMKPTSFTFKPSRNNMSSLKGHINGFIIKLWQWVTSKPNIKLHKRSLPVANNTYRVNSLIERIVLITFNETDIHVTNSSSTEVVQLCLASENHETCQPDLQYQNDSLLIADLDKDGSQELISFSSTFDARNSHQLVSNVKVICLEAELPKLYEVAK